MVTVEELIAIVVVICIKDVFDGMVTLAIELYRKT